MVDGLNMPKTSITGKCTSSTALSPRLVIKNLNDFSDVTNTEVIDMDLDVKQKIPPLYIYNINDYTFANDSWKFQHL